MFLNKTKHRYIFINNPNTTIPGVLPQFFQHIPSFTNIVKFVYQLCIIKELCVAFPQKRGQIKKKSGCKLHHVKYFTSRILYYSNSSLLTFQFDLLVFCDISPNPGPDNLTNYVASSSAS